MRKLAAVLMIASALSAQGLANVILCGLHGPQRSFDPDPFPIVTNYYCEKVDAQYQVLDILASLGAAASPDMCSGCPANQVGCTRLGHVILGPTAVITRVDRANELCPDDELEHAYTIDAPDALHYISCTECLIGS
jgi:hypothetical protein